MHIRHPLTCDPHSEGSGDLTESYPNVIEVLLTIYSDSGLYCGILGICESTNLSSTSSNVTTTLQCAEKVGTIMNYITDNNAVTSLERTVFDVDFPYLNDFSPAQVSP